MKTSVLAGAMLLVWGACAHAGEMNWTGFHAGIHGGYAWSRGDMSAAPGDPLTQNLSGGQPTVPGVSTSASSNGWLGGAQAGYDWQFSDRGIVGIAADIAGVGGKSSASVASTMFAGTQAVTFDLNRRVDWIGTVRGRLGFLAAPDLLLYGTGGFAYGRVKDAGEMSLPPGQSNSIGNFGYAFACGPTYGLGACFAGNSSRIATGWTAGFGGEKRFTPNLSLTFEYLHVDLGDSRYVLTGSLYSGAPFQPAFLNAQSAVTLDILRAGLNYRF